MREVVTMWRYTRMIVLVGLTAAIYAAALIPFKPIPIIPGFTEIRPANVFPVICSLMFGPAAAWGSAFGNLIGDFFGTPGPGSFFGFIGNFLYGYVPYRAWDAISRSEPIIKSRQAVFKYLAVAFLVSLICAVIIGWGVDLLGLVPFAALGNIILLNNFLVAAVLGPVLLSVLYPRVKRWGLLYQEIMDPEDLSKGRFGQAGHVLLWLGGLAALILGNALSIGVYKSGLFASGFAQGLKGQLGLGLGLAPFIALVLIAALLI